MIPLWLVWLSKLSAGLETKGLLVQFPVSERAWVFCQVPSRGNEKGNYTLMFLSIFSSLPTPLSKTKKQTNKQTNTKPYMYGLVQVAQLAGASS